MIKLKLTLSIERTEPLSTKNSGRVFKPMPVMVPPKILTYGFASLVALAYHWLSNDPGPTKLLVEEIIRAAFR